MFDYKEWYKNRGGRNDYYLEHKEEYLRRSKKWKKEHPDKVKEQKRKWNMKRKKRNRGDINE